MRTYSLKSLSEYLPLGAKPPSKTGTSWHFPQLTIDTMGDIETHFIGDFANKKPDKIFEIEMMARLRTCHSFYWAESLIDYDAHAKETDALNALKKICSSVAR